MYECMCIYEVNKNVYTYICVCMYILCIYIIYRYIYFDIEIRMHSACHLLYACCRHVRCFRPVRTAQQRMTSFFGP